MILRILNFIVIGALVVAAAYVYRIKFESTVQAEHNAKLRDEVQHARDRVAALRAQWGALDDPARIEGLVKRFLKLKPVDPTQFADLDRLPDQPPAYMRPGSKDPIGGMIEHLEEPEALRDPDAVTGSVPPSPAQAGETPSDTDPAENTPASPVPSVPGALSR
jgi:hypothetical protein